MKYLTCIIFVLLGCTQLKQEEALYNKNKALEDLKKTQELVECAKERNKDLENALTLTRLLQHIYLLEKDDFDNDNLREAVEAYFENPESLKQVDSLVNLSHEKAVKELKTLQDDI